MVVKVFIQYSNERDTTFNVATSGNSTDFGDLNNTNHEMGAIGTMHIFGGSNAPAKQSQIDMWILITR